MANLDTGRQTISDASDASEAKRREREEKRTDDVLPRVGSRLGIIKICTPVALLLWDSVENGVGGIFYEEGAGASDANEGEFGGDCSRGSRRVAGWFFCFGVGVGGLCG